MHISKGGNSIYCCKKQIEDGFPLSILLLIMDDVKNCSIAVLLEFGTFFWHHP